MFHKVEERLVTFYYSVGSNDVNPSIMLCRRCDIAKRLTTSSMKSFQHCNKLALSLAVSLISLPQKSVMPQTEGSLGKCCRPSVVCGPSCTSKEFNCLGQLGRMLSPIDNQLCGSCVLVLNTGSKNGGVVQLPVTQEHGQ